MPPGQDDVTQAPAVPPEGQRAAPAPRYSVAVLAFVLFLLSASHMLLYDYFGVRLIAQIVFGSVMVVLLAPGVIEYLLSGRLPAFAVLCLVFAVVDAVWRQDVKNVAEYLVTCFLIVAAFGFGASRTAYFAKVMAWILACFAVAGFLQVFIVLRHPELATVIVKGFDSGYYRKIPISNPVEWLGGADSTVHLFGISFPRFVTYVEQASAVPAYILLPAALVLVSGIRRRRLAYLPILFAPLSLGGSVFVCLATAVALFAGSRALSRRVLTWLPWAVLTGYVVIATIALSGYVLGDQAFIAASNPHVVESEERELAVNRANSGFQRMILLVRAAQTIATSPAVGMRHSDEEIFASLVLTSGQRAGLLGLIVAIWAFGGLFRRICDHMQGPPHDRHSRFGLALLYATAFQAVVYNDYGFSKLWGLTMFAIAMVMLRNLAVPAALDAPDDAVVEAPA